MIKFLVVCLMLLSLPAIFSKKPAGKPPITLCKDGYFITLYDLSGDSTADRADYRYRSGGVPGDYFKKDSVPTEEQKKYFKEH